MSVAVGVDLLGPLRVTVDGVALEGLPRKERALLELLALNVGRAVPVASIVSALWGEQELRSERKSIQVLVYRVRRRLADAGVDQADELVGTEGEAYVLRLPADAVDANRFADLAARARRAAAADPVGAGATFDEALALWRGDPLPDLADSDVGRAERTRLAEQKAVVEDDRFEAGLAAGRADELVGELEVALSADPLRERRWRQLMLAQYRSGRQADALRAYQRARSVLVDELGIEPGPELRRLEAAVVAQDPSLELGPAAAGSGGPSSPSAEAAGSDGRDALRRWAGPASTPLVDRRADVERIAESFVRAESGLAVVVVSGEDGVGKTRVVADAVGELAEKGALVLAGSCTDRHTPAAPLREGVERWASTVGSLGDRGWPPGTLRTLADLSPSVAERVGIEPGEGHADPYEIAAAVASLAQPGELPLVVVVDDLRRADEVTLATLSRLVAAHAHARLLLVLCHRHTESGSRPEVLDLLSDLHRLEHHEGLRLGGLGPEAGAELLALRLGTQPDDRWSLALATLSLEVAGKPRDLLAVAARIEEAFGPGLDGPPPAGIEALGLPDGVADRVLRRLRLLAEEHQQVLRAASVLGSVFELQLLATVAEVTEADALAAVEAAGRAGLVHEPDAGRVAFTSASTRLAVYQRLSAGRQARLHERAGRALTERERQRHDERIAEATDHLTRSRMVGDGAEPDTDRGSAAGGGDRYLAAYEEAVKEVEAIVGGLPGGDSLDAERRCTVLLGLAASRRRSGDLASARALYEQAAQEARGLGRADLLARAAAGAAEVVVEVGVTNPPIVALLEEASASLDADDPLQDDLRAALVPELVWAGDWRAALAVSERRAGPPTDP